MLEPNRYLSDNQGMKTFAFLLIPLLAYGQTSKTFNEINPEREKKLQEIENKKRLEESRKSKEQIDKEIKELVEEKLREKKKNEVKEVVKEKSPEDQKLEIELKRIEQEKAQIDKKRTELEKIVREKKKAEEAKEQKLAETLRIEEEKKKAEELQIQMKKDADAKKASEAAQKAEDERKAFLAKKAAEDMEFLRNNRNKPAQNSGDNSGKRAGVKSGGASGVSSASSKGLNSGNSNGARSGSEEKVNVARGGNAPIENHSDSTIGINHFGCKRDSTTKYNLGELACLGLWEYGNIYGGDPDMCGGYTNLSTGCSIKTNLCLSGRASAKELRIINYHQDGLEYASDTEITHIAKNLKITTEEAKKNLLVVWYYHCI